MYEQAVAESERTGVKRDININKSDKAKVIKEKFEKGEIVNNEFGEIDENNSSITTNGEEDEMSVFEAGMYKNIFIFYFLIIHFIILFIYMYIGISKKSRSLFMELDANAKKSKQATPIVNTKKEYIPVKQV